MQVHVFVQSSLALILSFIPPQTSNIASTVVYHIIQNTISNKQCWSFVLDESICFSKQIDFLDYC